MRVAGEKPYDVAFVPSAASLRWTSLGHPTLAANLMWLRAVQYMGEPRADERGWSKLRAIVELVTDLDPRHGYAYQTSANLLSTAGLLSDSNAILEKGTRNVPDRYILPFQRAVNAFLYAGDYAEAGRWFEVAAKAPGAPPHLRDYVLAMYVKGDAAGPVRRGLLLRRGRAGALDRVREAVRATAHHRAAKPRAAREPRAHPRVREVEPMRILAVAAVTVREALRRKVQVNLLLFALLLVIVSLVVSTLTLGESHRIAADLGLTTMEAMGSLIAIFLGASAIAGDIERRVVYPIIAKPISRSGYLLGRYLGLAATLLLNLAVMGLTLAALLTVQEQSLRPLDLALLSAVAMIGVQLLVVAAVAVLFSAVTTTTLAAIFALALTIAGRLSTEDRKSTRLN